MPKVRGGAEVRRAFASLPGEIEKLLRGAGRVAVKVVAEEAKARSLSHEVAEAVSTRVTAKDGRIVGRVYVKGRQPNRLGFWQEYGTDPHFISVADDRREGQSVRRINRKVKDGEIAPESLLIGGRFVGPTVHHPGARPHPFLRPALDTKEAEAIAAAQGYIDARVTPRGIVGADDRGDDGDGA